MVTIETISIVFTGISISLAAFYYISTLRNAQKTQQMTLDSRRTTLFLQFYGTATPEMIKRGSELLSWEWDDIEDFNVKYWNDLSTRVECQSFLVRFDGLGLLAMRNQVDLDLIYKFAPPIIPIWDKFEDVIKHQRENRQRPDLFEGFEFLYGEMLKRRQTANPTQ
jgi:hypothetical protein